MPIGRRGNLHLCPLALALVVIGATACVALRAGSGRIGLTFDPTGLARPALLTAISAVIAKLFFAQ